MVRIHDTTNGWREVVCSSDAPNPGLLAFSADGRRLIVTEPESDRDRVTISASRPYRHVPMTLLSVPDLEVLGRWTWVCPTNRGIRNLALSPDGRTVALATNDAVCPAVFDARTGRPIGPEPYPGSIRDVFFLPDGKTIRTLDSENRACLWDTATMRPRGQIELGRYLIVLSARPPDGKYLLCQDYRYSPEEPLLCVVNADTGGVVSTFPEVGGNKDEVLWLNDSQLILRAADCLIRLDYLRGEIIKQSQAFRHSGQLKASGPDWQPERLKPCLVNHKGRRPLRPTPDRLR